LAIAAGRKKVAETDRLIPTDIGACPLLYPFFFRILNGRSVIIAEMTMRLELGLGNNEMRREKNVLDLGNQGMTVSMVGR